MRGIIGDFFNVKGGKRLPKGSTFEHIVTDHPYIRVTDFRKNGINKSNLKYISADIHKQIERYIINEDDLYISIAGTIGVVGIIPKDLNGANLTENAAKIIPKDGVEVEPKFLSYYLNSDSIQGIIRSKTMAVGVPKLALFRIQEIPVSLPPLETQKKIAAILDAADGYRQKTKALIAKYEELTQSLFLDMFGDPVRNEKGWEKKTISSLTSVSSGSTPSRENDYNFEGLVPWVKTGEVNGKIIMQTEEHISESALANSSCRIYPINSIIIAMYGQGKTRGQVGVLGIEATTNQACAVIAPSDSFVTSFLFRHLGLCYEDLRSLGRGGNQPNLNSGLIKSYKVILPPIDLQNQFATRVQKIEAQKAQAQHSLEKAEELFNSLLQRAFKGELV